MDLSIEKLGSDEAQNSVKQTGVGHVSKLAETVH